MSSSFSSQNASNRAATTEQVLTRGANNFNFLRLMLASLVLFSHSFDLMKDQNEPLRAAFGTLSFGELAVDGFFLISGFLVVRSWQGNPHLWPYFKKRVLRIYPGFVVAFLLCVLLVGPLGTSLSVGDYFSSLSWPRQFGSLLLLSPPLKIIVFEGWPYPDLNGAMWTIAYEFRCYVLVALLGLAGFVRKPALWLALTIVFAALYPFRHLVPDPDFPGISYFFGFAALSIRLLLCFLVGGCYFLLLHRIRFITPVALLFLPVVAVSLLNQYIAEIIIATLGAYILFWFAFLPIASLDHFKHHADVSYGLYLYGWPVQKLLLWYLPIGSPWLLFILALLVSYFCGYISWHLIERPALKFKRRTPRDPRILSA